MTWLALPLFFFLSGPPPLYYGYKTIEIGGRLWLAENLNCEAFEAFCFGDEDRHCTKFGKLYTWESAKLACQCLGEDWELPTQEDWQELVDYFGGHYNAAYGSGQAAYSALIMGGSSGFNAQLGGMINLNPGKGPTHDFYSRLKTHGHYWSSTEKGLRDAWYYTFSGTNGVLYRYFGKKTAGYSVRCVKAKVLE